MYIMINCKQAGEYVSQREEGRLSFSKRMQLLLHLAICSFCRLFVKQTRLMKQCSAHACNNCEESLSSEEKQQLIQNLQQQL